MENYRRINTYCIMNCDIRLYKGSFRPKRQNEKPILQIKYESIKHKHNCPNYGIIIIIIQDVICKLTRTPMGHTMETSRGGEEQCKMQGGRE